MKKFNTVAFLLITGIFMACNIFPGIILHKIPLDVAGFALLLFVGLPHIIGTFIAVHEGKTLAATVIMIFLSFWLYLSLGLLLFPYEDLSAGLVYIEPGMFIAIYFLQYFYRKARSLQYILLGLATTVLYLWLSKLIPFLGPGIPIVVTSLGIWVLIVGIMQFHQLEKQS